MPLKEIAAFQNAMLGWYKANARDLPWRRTKDPYKIWVSEIMLQQTRVDTVIPYYEKWFKRFPTLTALARAPRPEVLKFWAGLGYYRRARMLHDTARLLIKKYDGKFPQKPEALDELPGIGRYTAGAVASIAFGEKTPVLDGNVIRILTRIEAVKADIGSPATIAKLWKVAGDLVPAENPGDFNQATMELGATVCLPENPRCNFCPVTRFCVAYQMERPTAFPVKKRRERIEKIRTAALILRKNGKVLIEKQPADGRWGGLWMFPYLKERLSARLPLRHRMTIHHGFTRYRVRLDVYEAKKTFPFSGGTRKDRLKWAKIGELPNLAFPSPHQKIVRELVENHG